MKNIITLLVVLFLISCSAKKEVVDVENNTTKNNTKKTKSLTKEFLQKIETSGITDAVKWFTSTMGAKDYYLDENEMREMAYSLLDIGSVDESLEVLRLNAQAFPNSKEVFDSNIMISIARQLADQGLTKQAFNFLDLNMKVHSSSESSHRGFGDFYLKQKEHDLAIKYYKKAAYLNPKNNLFQIVFKASNNYKPTVLPRDTTKLFEIRGEFEKDTAFIYVQGGPDLKLNIHENDALHLLSDSRDILKIYPLQAAMLNPDMVVSIPSITAEQAEFENGQSVEILYRTIRYLKNKGKMVYVIGHSHGAGIGYNYINNKDIQPDKIVLMGRDPDEDMRSFEGLGKGEFVRWEDGTKPYITKFFRDIPDDFPVKDKLDAVIANLEMLVKSHSEKRYTNILKNKNLSHLVFVHARFDEANGRTSISDLEFFRLKGVQAVETYGDHHSMLTKAFMTNLYDHLVKGAPLKQSIASKLTEELLKTGGKEAIKTLNSIRKTGFYHPISEREINLLGYQLLKEKKIKDAIEVFKLNVNEFPNSANTYDSLGEAYMLQDEKKLAVENYKRSLELNPKNTNATQMLERLNEQE